MSRVRVRDTAPEMTVRRALYASGIRYRLHDKRIPGKPDIFIPRLKVAIFVHGCFWHGHDCPRGKLPKSNAEFWSNKILGNRRRDEIVAANLIDRGLTVIIIWACELGDTSSVVSHLAKAYRRASITTKATAKK